MNLKLLESIFKWSQLPVFKYLDINTDSPNLRTLLNNELNGAVINFDPDNGQDELEFIKAV